MATTATAERRSPGCWVSSRVRAKLEGVLPQARGNILLVLLRAGTRRLTAGKTELVIVWVGITWQRTVQWGEKKEAIPHRTARYDFKM